MHPEDTTMALTLEERRQIARINGSKSKGPLNDFTRWLSSRNSLVHGAYARVHILDDEDPDELEGLRQRYLDDDEPQSATEEFLVLEKYHGDVASRRLRRARGRALKIQGELNREKWEQERGERADKLHGLLIHPDTPELGPIVDELRTFGHGVVTLATGWDRLRAGLAGRDFLCPEEINMGVRLMGVRPAREAVARREDAYLFSLWALGAHPAPPPGMLEALLEPANRPEAFRDDSLAELLPDRTACREQLRRWFDDELADLAALAQEVAREVDGPELAEVLDPAAIVLDAADARRYDRAASDYRATYYRGLYGLEAVRKRRDQEARNAERSQAKARPPARASREDRINAQASRRRSAATPSDGLSDATEVVVEQGGAERPAAPTPEPRNEPTLAPDGGSAEAPNSVSTADAGTSSPFFPTEGGTHEGPSPQPARSGASVPLKPPFARGGAPRQGEPQGFSSPEANRRTYLHRELQHERRTMDSHHP
jgi:hypothetical protein